VHLARGELTLAVSLAASRGLSLSRLIVGRAIPIANRAVTTVAFRCSVGRPTVVVVTIVEDAMTTTTISSLVDVPASIVAKGELTPGALAAPTVRDVAEASAKLLWSFPKETLAELLRFLSLNRTFELPLLEKSLKKGGNGLDCLVIERFTATNELFAIVFVVGHVVPLEGESVRWLLDITGEKELGNTEHLFETMQMDARRGK
jgi:hypothetical protein